MKCKAVALLLIALALFVVPVDAAKKSLADQTQAEYVRSLIFAIAPGVALAVISVCVFFLYFFIRCCCCICGKSCCPQPKPEGYTSREVTVAIILVILVGVLAIVGGVIIYAGGSQTAKSMKNFFGELVDLLVDFVQQLSEIIAKMAEAEEKGNSGGDGSSSSESQQVLEVLEEAKDAIENSESSVNKGFGYINLAGIIIGSIVLVVILIAYIAVWCKSKGLLVLPIVLVWILLFLTWSMFGGTMAFQKLFDDVCNEVELYKVDPESSALGKVIPCPEQSGPNPVTVFKELCIDVVVAFNDQLTDIDNQNGGAPPEVDKYVCVPYVLNGDGEYVETTIPSPECKGSGSEYQITMKEFGTTTEYDEFVCQEDDPSACPSYKIPKDEWQGLKE
eukprot:TRINITY_DN10279_c0_g1_i1.p1 TRINITY_DN10279_c0_g1~~TRINITY_DN10279_c0_g1_i1.p1  ORF type:complete len:391 (+),score=50.41 TRINITY_DN10279_c0_g1_i1:445-1617(+)